MVAAGILLLLTAESYPVHAVLSRYPARRFHLCMADAVTRSTHWFCHRLLMVRWRGGGYGLSLVQLCLIPRLEPGGTRVVGSMGGYAHRSPSHRLGTHLADLRLALLRGAQIWVVRSVHLGAGDYRGRHYHLLRVCDATRNSLDRSAAHAWSHNSDANAGTGNALI